MLNKFILLLSPVDSAFSARLDHVVCFIHLLRIICLGYLVYFVCLGCLINHPREQRKEAQASGKQGTVEEEDGAKILLRASDEELEGGNFLWRMEEWREACGLSTLECGPCPQKV